jgi:hypothetical protein
MVQDFCPPNLNNDVKGFWDFSAKPAFLGFFRGNGVDTADSDDSIPQHTREAVHSLSKQIAKPSVAL